MEAFIAQSQRSTGWQRVGLVSQFPDLSLEKDCAPMAPSCKAFTIPKTSSPRNPQAPAEADLELPGEDLKDQVLVFQYKGKMHAIDHQCPHSSFPLSKGSLFDVEDFGIVLSAGITCPKHGWSFDLFSGVGDRGNYKLKVWEVQLRDPPTDENPQDPSDQEVWVRRKQRIG